MPPEMKRFDGRLAVPIGKIFGKVPELQPVRMVTPNVLWDRPRARIKFQHLVQCTIFISITFNWRSLAVLDGSVKSLRSNVRVPGCFDPFFAIIRIPSGASFHTEEM